MPPESQFQSVVAYTTSQPWPHTADRPGVVSFSAEEAAAFGQARAFVLHLWRVAHLPITPVWFPSLSTPGRGVVGSVSRKLRLELEAKTVEVFTRHRTEIERLGPLRPKPSR